jgi:hypothetical protein
MAQLLAAEFSAASQAAGGRFFLKFKSVDSYASFVK